MYVLESIVMRKTYSSSRSGWFPPPPVVRDGRQTYQGCAVLPWGSIEKYL